MEKHRPDDEIFTFLATRFNVTKAKNIIMENNIKPVSYPLEELTGMMGFINIDTKYALETDNQSPLIGARLTLNGEVVLLVIDGWHRLYRWNHYKRKQAPVCVLDLEQSQQIKLK